MIKESYYYYYYLNPALPEEQTGRWADGLTDGHRADVLRLPLWRRRQRRPVPAQRNNEVARISQAKSRYRRNSGAQRDMPRCISSYTASFGP